MKPKTNPYPHKCLTKEEVKAVRNFFDKYGLRFSDRRHNLLIQGHRGRLDESAYRRYCRCLRRIHHEMACVKHGMLILIENSDRVQDIPYNHNLLSSQRLTSE